MFSMGYSSNIWQVTLRHSSVIYSFFFFFFLILFPESSRDMAGMTQKSPIEMSPFRVGTAPGNDLMPIFQPTTLCAS